MPGSKRGRREIRHKKILKVYLDAQLAVFGARIVDNGLGNDLVCPFKKVIKLYFYFVSQDRLICYFFPNK